MIIFYRDIAPPKYPTVDIDHDPIVPIYLGL